MKRLKTSRMTAQGNSWVPYVQGSDGVVISPKKLDWVGGAVKQKGVEAPNIEIEVARSIPQLSFSM
jgi:hypothetical protein